MRGNFRKNGHDAGAARYRGAQLDIKRSVWGLSRGAKSHQPRLLCVHAPCPSPQATVKVEATQSAAHNSAIAVSPPAPPLFEGGIPNGAASVAASSPRCMTRQRQHVPPGTRAFNSRAHVGREQEGGRGAYCLQGHVCRIRLEMFSLRTSVDIH